MQDRELAKSKHEPLVNLPDSGRKVRLNSSIKGTAPRKDRLERLVHIEKAFRITARWVGVDYCSGWDLEFFTGQMLVKFEAATRAGLVEYQEYFLGIDFFD